jgi:formylmethanofuran dehydrogenase subunit E
MRLGRIEAPAWSWALPLAAAALVACGGSSTAVAPPSASTVQAADSSPHHHHGHGHAHGQAPASAGDPIEKKLDEVAAIHGAAGPWAVAGYRMSEHALGKLGLERGSFDLQIVHWTPKEVRYSCIADGAAAHSGASLGKLNLSLVETTADNVLTIYRDKKSGKSIALRPTASFRERFNDTPREKARELGRQVLELPAEQVFEEIPVK